MVEGGVLRSLVGNSSHIMKSLFVDPYFSYPQVFLSLNDENLHRTPQVSCLSTFLGALISLNGGNCKSY